jgi:hypothetical protein
MVVHPYDWGLDFLEDREFFGFNDGLCLLSMNYRFVDLMLKYFFLLFMNHISVFLFNDVLVFFMDHRLMNFVNVLLSDDRLDILFNHRLVMLMDYLLLVLEDDILVVFMYDILMFFLDNGRKNNLPNNGSISMFYYCRGLNVIFDNYVFFTLHHN